MRVLLDENLPRGLAGELEGHKVVTVQAAGWSAVTNGELLQRAEHVFDVLLTMDRSIRYQQNLDLLRLSVLIVRARSNRMADLRPLIGSIVRALNELQPGQVREIGQ